MNRRVYKLGQKQSASNLIALGSKNKESSSKIETVQEKRFKIEKSYNTSGKPLKFVPKTVSSAKQKELQDIEKHIEPLLSQILTVCEQHISKTVLNNSPKSTLVPGSNVELNLDDLVLDLLTILSENIVLFKEFASLHLMLAYKTKPDLFLNDEIIALCKIILNEFTKLDEQKDELVSQTQCFIAMLTLAWDEIDNWPLEFFDAYLNDVLNRSDNYSWSLDPSNIVFVDNVETAFDPDQNINQLQRKSGVKEEIGVHSQPFNLHDRVSLRPRYSKRYNEVCDLISRNLSHSLSNFYHEKVDQIVEIIRKSIHLEKCRIPILDFVEYWLQFPKHLQLAQTILSLIASQENCYESLIDFNKSFAERISNFKFKNKSTFPVLSEALINYCKNTGENFITCYLISILSKDSITNPFPTSLISSFSSSLPNLMKEALSSFFADILKTTEDQSGEKTSPHPLNFIAIRDLNKIFRHEISIHNVFQLLTEKIEYNPNTASNLVQFANLCILLGINSSIKDEINSFCKGSNKGTFSSSLEQFVESSFTIWNSFLDWIKKAIEIDLTAVESKIVSYSINCLINYKIERESNWNPESEINLLNTFLSNLFSMDYELAIKILKSTRNIKQIHRIEVLKQISIQYEQRVNGSHLQSQKISTEFSKNTTLKHLNIIDEIFCYIDCKDIGIDEAQNFIEYEEIYWLFIKITILFIIIAIKNDYPDNFDLIQHISNHIPHAYELLFMVLFNKNDYFQSMSESQSSKFSVNLQLFFSKFTNQVINQSSSSSSLFSINNFFSPPEWLINDLLKINETSKFVYLIFSKFNNMLMKEVFKKFQSLINVEMHTLTNLGWLFQMFKFNSELPATLQLEQLVKCFILMEDVDFDEKIHLQENILVQIRNYVKRISIDGAIDDFEYMIYPLFIHRETDKSIAMRAISKMLEIQFNCKHDFYHVLIQKLKKLTSEQFMLRFYVNITEYETDQRLVELFVVELFTCCDIEQVLPVFDRFMSNDPYKFYSFIINSENKEILDKINILINNDKRALNAHTFEILRFIICLKFGNHQLMNEFSELEIPPFILRELVFSEIINRKNFYSIEKFLSDNSRKILYFYRNEIERINENKRYIEYETSQKSNFDTINNEEFNVEKYSQINDDYENYQFKKKSNLTNDLVEMQKNSYIFDSGDSSDNSQSSGLVESSDEGTKHNTAKSSKGTMKNVEELPGTNNKDNNDITQFKDLFKQANNGKNCDQTKIISFARFFIIDPQDKTEAIKTGMVNTFAKILYNSGNFQFYMHICDALISLFKSELASSHRVVDFIIKINKNTGFNYISSYISRNCNFDVLIDLLYDSIEILYQEKASSCQCKVDNLRNIIDFFVSSSVKFKNSLMELMVKSDIYSIFTSSQSIVYIYMYTKNPEILNSAVSLKAVLSLQDKKQFIYILCLTNCWAHIYVPFFKQLVNECERCEISKQSLIVLKKHVEMAKVHPLMYVNSFETILEAICQFSSFLHPEYPLQADIIDVLMQLLLLMNQYYSLKVYNFGDDWQQIYTIISAHLNLAQKYATVDGLPDSQLKLNMFEFSECIKKWLQSFVAEVETEKLKPLLNGLEEKQDCKLLLIWFKNIATTSSATILRFPLQNYYRNQSVHERMSQIENFYYSKRKINHSLNSLQQSIASLGPYFI